MSVRVCVCVHAVAGVGLVKKGRGGRRRIDSTLCEVEMERWSTLRYDSKGQSL